MTKSIKLAYSESCTLSRPWAGYKVVSVKNSTAYNPSETMPKSEVDALCNNPRWDVTIVPASGK